MQQVTGFKRYILGVQMLFVAFGALVLVPLLTGLDPSIALFTAGIGTIIFQFTTKAMVPVFLASSFAFIDPIKHGIATWGIGATLGALALTGVVYALLSLLVKVGGVELIKKIVPPVVAGPVIMVIGLKLAPIAVNMFKSFDGIGTYDSTAVLVSSISLITAIIVVIYGKKLLSLIPILCGIVVGYIVCIILQQAGVLVTVSDFNGGTLQVSPINFSKITDAAWFSLPWVEAIKNGKFAAPVFDLAAIMYIVPVAIAPAIEHIGDVLAISGAAGKDYIKEPGLHRTLLGDGIATSAASFLGGPPNTTYSEVTGAVALTKAFDPFYMRVAAVTAIVLSFSGKLGGILQTIPTPVMGGIMVLLFGMIASIGIGTMTREKVDMSSPKNLVITSVILVVGIGGLSVGIGDVVLSGIGLAGVVGIILNLLLMKAK